MASRSISSRTFFCSRYIHDLSDIGFYITDWRCCFDLLPVGFSSKKEEHRPGSHTSDIHGLDREILLLLCSSKQNIALSSLSGSCRTTFGQFWPKGGSVSLLPLIFSWLVCKLAFSPYFLRTSDSFWKNIFFSGFLGLAAGPSWRFLCRCHEIYLLPEISLY